MLTDKEIKIDYSGIPTSREDISGAEGEGVAIDYSSIPIPADNEIDYATMPTPKEFSPMDVLKQSVRNIPLPNLPGTSVGQIQDLLKADQDTQDLIKMATMFPYETLTGTAGEKEFTTARGTEFSDILRADHPWAESPNEWKQFAFEMSGSLLDYGTRPSTWVSVAAMKTYSKPLFEMTMEGIATKFPRLHKVLTKEFFPEKNKVIMDKLSNKQPLTPEEQKIFEENVRKAQEAFSQDAIKQRTEAALGQRARKDPSFRAKLRAERMTPEKPMEQLALPAPGETVKTPLTETPVRVFDSRTLPKDLTIADIARDVTGKPITIGENEIAVVSEAPEGGVETNVVAPSEVVEPPKAKGKKVYHHGATELESRGGTWFTDNEFGAGGARSGAKGVVEAFIDESQLNLANNKQATEAGLFGGYPKEMIKKLKAQGFDGLKRRVGIDTHYMIFDESKITVPSQEVAQVNMEPEFIKALKAITEKVNEYTARGENPPESLLKRQKAFFGALEVTGKAGKPIPADKILGIIPPEKIMTTEKALLKERIKNMARGARTGRQFTKNEIKDNIKELKSYVEGSELEANDKAKFIGRLTNVDILTNPKRFKDTLLEVQNRVEELEIAQEKRIFGKMIDKEIKGTRDLKKGGKKVGRYDYENNKLFKEIREIAKLKQSDAAAQLAGLTGQPLDELGLIKTRMLSYVANGMESSLELRAQVLEDLQRLKATGETAKDELDFEKLLKREENIKELSQAIIETKGDKGTALNEFKKLYVKGFSNTYSAFNAIAGKEMAVKYDFESQYMDKVTEGFFLNKEIIETSSQILELKDPSQFNQFIAKLAEEKYELTDVTGKTVTINKDEVLDIYNSIKNPIVQRRYYNAYGEEQIQSLMQNVSDLEAGYADYLMEVIKEKDFFGIYNAFNVRRTGLDLNPREYYWPATSEYQVDVYDEFRINSQIPSAVKKFTESDKIFPRPSSAWLKLQNYLGKAVHLKHLGAYYEDTKRTILSRDIRIDITEKFGERVYDEIKNHIEHASINRYAEHLDAMSEAIGHLINNWSVAQIALNPNTYIKQLISMVNYAENMPAGTWAKGWTEGVADKKKTFDYMWENAKWLEARYNRGYSEAITRALNEMQMSGEDSFSKTLSVLSRQGDITAIIYGGYPYVKWLQTPEGGGLTKEQAFEKYKDSLKTQQSPLPVSLSRFQNSNNPLTRMFLAFKNTPNQYFRKGVDATFQYVNGDITGEQWAKTMFIYWVMNPLLLGVVSAVGGTAIAKTIGNIAREEDVKVDGKEMLFSVLLQIALSPVQAVPIIDDMLESAIRMAAGQNIQDAISTPVLSDINQAYRKMAKKKKTFLDWAELLGTPLEMGTKMPVGTGLRYYKAVMGIESGKPEKVKP